MAIEIKKKDGDNPNTLLFNFTKKVKRSGILREMRKRKYHARPISRIKRRLSAIHRDEKKKELDKMKKLGLL
jgi:ribosomal protein S21